MSDEETYLIELARVRVGDWEVARFRWPDGEYSDEVHIGEHGEFGIEPMSVPAAQALAQALLGALPAEARAAVEQGGAE